MEKEKSIETKQLLITVKAKQQGFNASVKYKDKYLSFLM